MIKMIKRKLQARKNRRNAIRLMAYSGVLRNADATVRYGMTKREISLMLKEDAS